MVTDNILLKIAEQVSEKTGDAYFRSLARFISEELGTDFAFIGEFIPGTRKVHTLCVYARGTYADNFEYDLAHTPCEHVVGKEPCFHPDNIQQLFPEDRMLSDMGVQSYAGIPIFDSGGLPLGLIATLGSSPFAADDAEKILPLLKIFSFRVSAEIERKRYQESLTEAAAQWQATFDAVRDSVCIIDTNHRITMCNRATGELLGKQLPEIVGRHCWSIFHKDMAMSAGCPCPEMIRTRSRASAEIGIGDLVFSISVDPIFDEQGRLSSYVHTARDITEHRKSEEALKTSELRYRNLVGSVTDYIYTVEIDQGRAASTKHGPGCVAITGYSPEEFAANPFLWFTMVKDEDRSAVIEQSEKVLAGGTAPPLEHRIIHKSGTVRWVRNTPVPRHDQNGVLVAYDGLISDITERKNAEIALRKSEEFVKNILDTVDESFIVIDREYRIISANRAYCEQVHMPYENILGRHCYEITHNNFRPCFDAGEHCAVKRVFSTGEHVAVTHRHFDGRGEVIHCETKAYPLRDAEGTIVSAIEIINNITDKMKLEEQLRQSQKMEAVGLLAGGVAHDFNNILSAIIGYGNLLEIKLAADDPLRTYVEQVIASAERAASLTQSLLAFSRKQIISPRPLDLNDIIRRVEKLLARLIGEDIELRTHLQREALTVVADPGQVEQILMNLATNARDAMPSGGSLTIETSEMDCDEQCMKLHGFDKSGRYAVLTMSDTGIGMDDTTRERIFEPFFTTKELGRGTGLGLSMVYGAIRQNGGFVDVYSSPGNGTTFTIYLPLEVIPRESEKAAAPQSFDRGTETIMIAEDDVVLRRLSSTVLKEFGYTVIEAVDGMDAITKFGEHRDRVKLVILDVIMPKKNGKEVYEEISRITPGIKVLFISGYTADIVHRKGILEPGLNFLSKPILPKTLLHIVRKLLDTQS